MKYQIIEDTDPEVVQDLVEEALEDGWKLQGGISVAMAVHGSYNSRFYAQAMVKAG